MSDEKTLKAATTVLFSAGYDGLASEVAKARKAIEREAVIEANSSVNDVHWQAAIAGWKELKTLRPKLDGVDYFYDLPPTKIAEYLAFTQGAASIADNLPAAPQVFKVGDRAKVTGPIIFGSDCSATSLFSTGERVNIQGSVDEDGDVLAEKADGRAYYIRATSLTLEVPTPRVFKVGDPEPADRDTITVTGERDGRTVELKYGRHGKFNGGEPLTWWWVNQDYPSYSDWVYWLACSGPLTEVLEG